ncbi:hypothetical protein DPMN_059476 [Dreissena polymorpha]|uniref:Uncharacterized protein n=1 Tax=Dreissena polymorpha TaxID=45954 RepID=A0A9D4HF33_DREPO|nr:hypothetical protein DPMN_059476 [Dreissena polymorpha]
MVSKTYQSDLCTCMKRKWASPKTSSPQMSANSRGLADKFETKAHSKNICAMGAFRETVLKWSLLPVY